MEPAPVCRNMTTGLSEMYEIDLGRDFSETPLGRTRRQGPYSGEAFREDILRPALVAHERVTVILDNATGLSTGVLDEAFAGLVRDGTLEEAEFWRRVLIVANRDPGLIHEIRSFVARAAQQRAQN